MAETMDKQRLLDELRRGTGIVPQAAVSDKQKILDSLRQPPVQSDSTNYFAPISQGENAKSYVRHLSNKSTFAPIVQEKTAEDYVSHLKIPEQPQESQGYFQKGAFEEDAPWLKKAVKAYIGTGKDIGTNLAAGILGMGEKAVDTGAYILGAEAGLVGLDKIKDKMSDFIKKDLYDEEKVARTKVAQALFSPMALVGDVVADKMGVDEDTDSVIGQKGDALAKSAGQLLGNMAITAASGGTVPWWAVTGVTSFGSEAENALRQGASMSKAGLSAAISAGAEVFTEKLFGGSGLGEKGLVNLDGFTKGVTNKVAKTLLDYGIDMGAEGFEEVLSSVMSNLGSALYRDERLLDIMASKEALMGYLDAFLSGAAMGGLMNVGKVGSSILEDVISRRTAQQKPATPTQSGETAQTEKVPTQAETPTQAAQTAQTHSQPMTPQQAMQETIAETIGVPSVTQAVESFRQNGKVSNSQAEAIVADEGVFREILEMTGIAPPSTKSESRAAVKQAVAKLAQETVSDNAKIASESIGADATIAENTIPAETTPNPNESVGAAPAGFSGDGVYEEMKSRYVTNTMANATDESFRNSGKAALKADPDLGTYYKSKEKDSLRFAQARTQTPEMVEQEYNYLMENGINSAEDVDTAKIVQTKLFEAGDRRFIDMAKLTRGTGTQSGQIIQAFAKYTRMTGEDAAAEVVTEMDKLKESDVPKRFYKDSGFEQWKGDVSASAMNIAKQIDSVEDGDVDGMKDIIRSMAKWRKTTAWFGLSSDLSKAAEAAMKDIDFETAKAIANAQLSTLPGDFKKRPVGQVVKTIRIHNMLSALTTINRNLVGNTAVGFIDATSDSTSGRLIDALVSKVTGKRTVGNDIKYGKTYMDAAWKATKMASLCAELDIPMDSESRFTTGTTRNYSPQGNPIMRFMSAYEKYMKYALEVTDQFYQGGANAAVDASLQEISGNETLTQEEAEAIAKLAGQRRTLKDERAATRMAKKLRQGLNEFGTENMGLGDLTMPFASIGSTSAHVAVDYTAGSVTGLAQVFQLMSDVKKGRYVNGVKTIYKNGKPVRTVTLAEAQRAAVTNAGRGVTGLGLVTVFAGLAAAGVLKVHDDKDKDKRGLEQAQNLSGAQLNIDAALRGLQGKSTDWQNDDLVISVDFLEPFNAQMYLGYLLSQDESVLDAAKSYPKHAIRSVVSSIADMPAMQGMQEALDLLNGASSLDEFAASTIGNTASGFIPGWLRQTAQVIDPYYRDTTGDTATEAALNQLKAAIPGFSQTLPKKYSGLGQEQLRDDDWISGIFNTMVNPGDADRIKTTEVTEFLDELYDLTGDLAIYPDAEAPKSFDQDKKTYTISTKEETETYQKTYGSEVNKLYSEIIKSADFQNLDGADQAAVLEKANEAARALAKSKISKKYTPPSSIKNKPLYKSDAQAILDAYIEAKKKAEKEAQKKAAKEAYLATQNGQ